MPANMIGCWTLSRLVNGVDSGDEEAMVDEPEIAVGGMRLRFGCRGKLKLKLLCCWSLLKVLERPRVFVFPFVGNDANLLNKRLVWL